ncbi:hypothetical protein SCANM63S_10177 [Streptomyces canarius]
MRASRAKTAGLTLRGAGPGPRTQPPKKKTKPAPHGKKAAVTCLSDGNGICVVGGKNKPVKDVTVSDLKVTGFAKSGVFTMGTDHLTVKRVIAEHNGQWGIAQEHDPRRVPQQHRPEQRGRGDLPRQQRQGRAGGHGQQGRGDRPQPAGGQPDRHHRPPAAQLAVTRNYVLGNCAGVFVVGDENKPRAGALTVSDNLVDRNNKFCPKTARLPYLKGSGIVLTGTEKALVTRNRVTGHTGKSPLSGGIVLFKSFVGATSEQNRITANHLANNSPRPSSSLFVRVHGEPERRLVALLLEDLHRRVLAEQLGPALQVVGHVPDQVQRGGDGDLVLGVSCHVRLLPSGCC